MPGNPGYKLNYSLQLWFPLNVPHGGSDIRLNDDPGLKFSSVGQCLMGFSLALTVSELRGLVLCFITVC